MTDEHLPHDAPPRLLRIGEAAAWAGVSTRALRYYHELGLLTPTATTPGGARRYSESDLLRVHRIRHLRDLIGLDLKEVGRVLTAEDRLAAIRREWFEAQTQRRQGALLEEAMAINAEVQQVVRSKMTSLEDFLSGLERTAEMYRRKLRQTGGASLVKA